MSLTKFQQIAAKVYGGGDYDYIKTEDEAEDVGDTLFKFVLLELGEGEDRRVLSRMQGGRRHRGLGNGR